MALKRRRDQSVENDAREDASHVAMPCRLSSDPHSFSEACLDKWSVTFVDCAIEGSDRSRRGFARWHAVQSSSLKKVNHRAATVTVAPKLMEEFHARFTMAEPRAQRDH